MKYDEIEILWDESHIWGLMALRGFKSLGFKCRLVKTKDIADARALGKRGGALVVPGGNARRKAEGLGRRGLEAIRRFVRDGGLYLGFCGGAGLGLSQPDGGSLNLCPWERGAYSKRLYHLISGHVMTKSKIGGKLKLPVWWPGRFARGENSEVEEIALYEEPTRDLWMGDRPFFNRASETVSSYHFPSGEPLVIRGNYGGGTYILSYAHLETPDSPDANSLLLALIEGKYQEARIAPWSVTRERASTIEASNKSIANIELVEAWAEMENLTRLGEKAGIFQRRTPWLLGWTSGSPGISCNSFLAIISEAATTELTPNALARWRSERSRFRDSFALFREEAEKYFESLTIIELPNGERLIRDAFPEIREKLFGGVILGEGIIGELSRVAEELIYLSQSGIG